VLISPTRVNLVALVVMVLAVVLYLVAVRRARRLGKAWSRGRGAAFASGLVLYAGIEFGFLGAESSRLRLAFATRVVLLLLAVPMLLSLAHPAALLSQTVRGPTGRRLVALLQSRPVQLLGRPMVSPLIALGVLTIFMTPLSGPLRVSPISEAAISVLIPLVGLLTVGPLIEGSNPRPTTVVASELAVAFVEMVADALPGILIRLSPVVIDHLGAVTGTVPGWFPSPLRDQQMEGDLLWFFAEVGDLPALLILFTRLMRSDKTETQSWDQLTDEEVAALTQQHLRQHLRQRPR